MISTRDVSYGVSLPRNPSLLYCGVSGGARWVRSVAQKSHQRRKRKFKGGKKTVRETRPAQERDPGYPKNPYKHDRDHNSIDCLLQGSLFTPEASRLEDLAINLSHAIRAGLRDTDLFKRYSNRATVLSYALRPRDIALMLNAFTKVGYQDSGFNQAALRALTSRIQDATPQSLSLTLHALAQTTGDILQEVKDGPWLSRILQDIPHKLPHFNDHDLVLITTALGRFKIRDTALYDDLCLELAKRESCFKPFQIGALAYALGGAQIADSQVWDKLASDFLSATPVDPAALLPVLKMVFGAAEIYDQLKTVPPSLLECFNYVGTYVVANKEVFFRDIKPSGWIQLFHAFARVGYVNATLYDEFLNRLLRIHDSLGKGELRQVLFSLSRLGAREISHDKELANQLLHKLVPLVERFTEELGRSATMTVLSAYSNSDVRDITMLKGIMKHLSDVIPTLEPHRLVLVAEYLARWGVRSEFMLRKLMVAASQKLPLFYITDLTRFLKALADFKMTSSKFIVAASVFTRLQAAQIDPPSKPQLCDVLTRHAQLVPADKSVRQAVDETVMCIRNLDSGTAVVSAESGTAPCSPSNGMPLFGVQTRTFSSHAYRTAELRRYFSCRPISCTIKGEVAQNKMTDPDEYPRIKQSVWKYSQGNCSPKSCSNSLLSNPLTPLLIIRGRMVSEKPGYTLVPGIHHPIYRDTLRQRGGLGVRRLFRRLMKRRNRL